MKTAIASWLLSILFAFTALAADVPEASLPTAGGMNNSDFFRVLTNGHSAKATPTMVGNLLGTGSFVTTNDSRTFTLSGASVGGNAATATTATNLAGPIASLSIGTLTVTNPPVLNLSASTNYAASNIVSGGQLPVGTVSPTTMTSGLALGTDGSNRIWTNLLNGVSIGGTSAFANNANTPGPGISQCRQTVTVFDDLMGLAAATVPGPGGLSLQTGSGGAFTQLSGETNAPGIIQISTSTSASSRPCLTPIFAAGPLYIRGVFTNEWRVRFNELPGDGANTNTFIGRIGFHSSGAADPTYGAYFKFSTNDTHFECVAVNGGAETKGTNTTVVTKSVWYDLAVVFTCLAGSTTNCVFTVNGADSITLNNAGPSASSVAPSAQIKKDIGTLAVTMDVDYYFLGYTLAVTR